MKLITLVDRNTGHARSFVVDKISQRTILPILQETLAREARLMKDEAGGYIISGREFADHKSLQHRNEEYVRSDITTNTKVTSPSSSAA